MTRFRPCIDIHSGEVKQIVGGTLDSASSRLLVNHVSQYPPAHFARLYRDNALEGAHVIMLGPGNGEAAKDALQAWPGHLQIGGGINDQNAKSWLDAGASKVRPATESGHCRDVAWPPDSLYPIQQVIVTSFLFPDGEFSQQRLDAVLQALGGDKNRLVIDLSCRRTDHDRWFVAMNKWQTLTDMEINQGQIIIECFPDSRVALTFAPESIQSLEPYCSEFLIHAADKEGLQGGIDEELVRRLARWCSIPVTYAGGGRRLEDLELVQRLSEGKVDLTIGSALDCFGGSGVTLDECVEWNRKQQL